MTSPPPLTGIRVLEFAGLAPGPFSGLLLADYGATVLRVDRPAPGAHTSKPPPPTPDNLVRRKSSISVSVKSPAGLALIKALLRHADVVIDPYRPGVLEKIGLGPEEVLLRINPRLVIARMTGFRRDGKYKDMAGHDINYIAVSGMLSMFGRKGEPPYPPGNFVGDFAGGGAVCFMGILLALLARHSTGRGQVVEANMVDGAAYLGTFMRLATQTPMWSEERGTNVLDGGAPWYEVYETSDGKYVSVGALEPQFWRELLKGLALSQDDLPGPREDKDTWPALKRLFAQRFKAKTRAEWEQIFDGTDACVAPVLTQLELKETGYDQRPMVTLKETPGFAVSHGKAADRPPAEGQGSGYEGEGWTAKALRPGVGGAELLDSWMGWKEGREYSVQDGSLALIDHKAHL